MSDRFPYNLPSRQALCVEIRELPKYRLIEDNLVTFEDIFFSPTSTNPGRTFIEMIDLKTNIKSWFVYRRLDLNIALGPDPKITIVGKITPRTIVDEINRSRGMTFMEDDLDMSDDVLVSPTDEFVYTLKALSGSYAYYGKVDIVIRTTSVPSNNRYTEDNIPRQLENEEYRTLD